MISRKESKNTRVRHLEPNAQLKRYWFPLTHAVKWWLLRVSLFFLMGLSLSLGPIDRAFAQPGQDSIKPGAKGVVGGALLGAEIAVSVESFIGLHKSWHYGLGAGVGAIGGGVGGYYVGKANTAAATSFLVGGIFFAIPATVLMLKGMSHRPPTQETNLGQARFPTYQLQPLPPSGLIALEHGQWAWDIPSIAVSEISTREEQFLFGATQGPLVDVSLMRLRF